MFGKLENLICILEVYQELKKGVLSFLFVSVNWLWNLNQDRKYSLNGTFLNLCIDYKRS